MKVALNLVLAAGALGLVPFSCWAQPALVNDSPFRTAGVPAAAVPAVEPYQLTGVASSGTGTRICIFESKLQHSRWIAVGATADGISVQSYDPAQKQAVVAIGGARQTLALHESPSDAATPAATTADARARDARLLTGDLLAIGQQQREDYAKAHAAAAH
jgi:hypothetical protein